MIELDREFLSDLEVRLYDTLRLAWTRFEPLRLAPHWKCDVEELVDAMWALVDLQVIRMQPLSEEVVLLRRAWDHEVAHLAPDADDLPPESAEPAE